MKIIIEFEKEDLDILEEYMFDFKYMQGLIVDYSVEE